MPAPVITPVVTGTAPNQTIDLGNYTSQINAGLGVLGGEASALLRATAGAIQTTDQLFDADSNDYTPGFSVNQGTGGLAANTGYDASGYIDVSGADVFYISGAANVFYAWYNAAGYIGTGGRVGNVFTKPSGATRLRVTLHIAGGANPARVYAIPGDQPGVWAPYGGLLNPDRVSGLGGDAFSDGAVTPTKTSFLTPSKNLFRKATVRLGRLAANGTFRDAGADAVYSHNTEIMRVTPGQSYVCNAQIRFLTAYDVAGGVILAAGSNTAINAGTVITPPVGVDSYAISIANTRIEDCQFEAGTVSTGYVDWGYEIPPYISLSGAGGSLFWSGKKQGALGDSLTAQSLWITPLVAALGLVFPVNGGIGGTRVSGTAADAMWQDVRINALPADSDVVTFLGTTNDWAQNIPIGTIADTDPTATVYGGLNVIAAKLKARYPVKPIAGTRIPIFWGTVPLSSVGLPRTGFTDAYTNSHGTINAYNDAIRAVAAAEGFILMDFWKYAGFNEDNLTDLMKPESSLLHPNEAGGRLMAGVAKAEFQRYRA